MKAVIFDADGTLVDSVYFFIEVYHQAYHEMGVPMARSRIHKVVGMGCDKAVPHLTSPEWFKEHGSGLRQRAVELYHEHFLKKVELFPCAEELCLALKKHKIPLALASSSSSDIVDHYLSLFTCNDIFGFINTSSHDIRTKPDPDIFVDIVKRGSFRAEESVVIGDSIWDIRAARAAGLECICVLTGGYHPTELRAEGAVEIYQDVSELYHNLKKSIIFK